MNGPEDFERPAETLPPWQAARLAALLAAVAGVPVSDAERRSLAWLCGFEDHTVVHLGAVIRRARARSASLAARAARDEARSRHLEADRYRGQLADLCDWAGLDPEDVDDPYRALLAHLRAREPGGEAVISVQVDDETCPDCGRGGPHTPVPGKPGTVECRVCSASWEQQPGGGRS